MLRNIKVNCCILLAILISLHMCFSVSADSTEDINKATEDISITKTSYRNDTVIDDRPTFPDSESSLLPKQLRANPTSVDLSNSRFFPPVRNQYDIGNCTSWASVYYQFGYQVASMYSLDVSSDNNLFSPKWVHNIAKNNSNNGGSTYENVYKVLASNGSVRYSKFAPADDYVNDEATEYVPWHLNQADLEEALKYRVSANHHISFSSTSVSTPITSYDSDCLTNMKTFLSAGNILTITTDNSTWEVGSLSSQYNSTLNGQSVCLGLHDDDNDKTRHALAVVGYNDNITYDLNGNGTIQDFERGAFKIVNSYGPKWRNNGFIWIMYDALNKVSNTQKQNYENRMPVFCSYAYDVIGVKEYPCDVIAKITLNHSYRNQIKLLLGVSDINTTTPTTFMPTMLLQNTDSSNVSFSGNNPISEDATFIFDFGDLYALDTERSNCYIQVSDATSLGSTIVKEIKLIDGTGKTIVLDTEDKTIAGTTQTYKFKLGIVGDVNDDTNITNEDARLIQQYMAGLITLSSNDLTVADVNGDGRITTADGTTIQKYLANIIDVFPNGSIVLLG